MSKDTRPTHLVLDRVVERVTDALGPAAGLLSEGLSEKYQDDLSLKLVLVENLTQMLCVDYLRKVRGIHGDVYERSKDNEDR